MKENSNIISVIIIVKNNEKLIQRAINSVINQNFSNYECIIVNDGSKDNTKKILDFYSAKDNRIKSIHLSINVGRAIARNIGLESARGRYILFLDSDDSLPNTALKELYNIAEINNSDIVYSGVKCFDYITGKSISNHYTEWIIKREQHNIKLDDYLDLVDNHLIIGRLYRRKLITDNGILFSKIRKNAEDICFAFYTSFYAKRISIVPNIMAYNYSLGNYSAKANENKLFDARDNIFETIEFSFKNGSNPLIKRMIKKGAFFASDLERAKVIYKGSNEKLIAYIETLLPLIKRITIDILLDLPVYQREFSSNLIVGDFYNAVRTYEKWIKSRKNFLLTFNKRQNKVIINAIKIIGINDFDKEIIKRRHYYIKNENIKLAYNLDDIYTSTSWRITSILRKGKKIIRGLKIG